MTPQTSPTTVGTGVLDCPFAGTKSFLQTKIGAFIRLFAVIVCFFRTVEDACPYNLTPHKSYFECESGGQNGVPVPCVLSLDAGDDWKSPYTLSRSQCHETAEGGTEFYLFESPWVGMDRAAIRQMVETGNNVTLVGCTYDEHVRITLDAMGMGVLHWALGDRTKPCELDIYSFARLHA